MESCPGHFCHLCVREILKQSEIHVSRDKYERATNADQTALQVKKIKLNKSPQLTLSKSKCPDSVYFEIQRMKLCFWNGNKNVLCWHFNKKCHTLQEARSLLYLKPDLSTQGGVRRVQHTVKNKNMQTDWEAVQIKCAFTILENSPCGKAVNVMNPKLAEMNNSISANSLLSFCTINFRVAVMQRNRSDSSLERSKKEFMWNSE